jgi:hypothetical protein
MKNGKLFLDDFRNPKDAINLVPTKFNKSYWGDDWDIVRNYDEFVQYIKDNGVPEFVSFDHDLADEHHNDLFSDKNWFLDDSKIELAYQEYKEKTGLECAKFLVDYCVDENQSLPEYLVHSANPVGKKNIEGYLENSKKHLNI